MGGGEGVRPALTEVSYRETARRIARLAGRPLVAYPGREIAVIGVERGTYRIIRVDGTETLVRARPSILALHRSLGSDCLDTVVLTMRRGIPEAVMMVDDTGMIDNKPVNRAATELVQLARHGYPHNIHGDVAVVNDHDFES